MLRCKFVLIEQVLLLTYKINNEWKHICLYYNLTKVALFAPNNRRQKTSWLNWKASSVYIFSYKLQSALISKVAGRDYILQ